MSLHSIKILPHVLSRTIICLTNLRNLVKVRCFCNICQGLKDVMFSVPQVGGVSGGGAPPPGGSGVSSDTAMKASSLVILLALGSTIVVALHQVKLRHFCNDYSTSLMLGIHEHSKLDKNLVSRVLLTLFYFCFLTDKYKFSKSSPLGKE